MSNKLEDNTNPAADKVDKRPLSDPILEFVRKETENWNNRGFSKQSSVPLGAGKFYAVSFVGQDNEIRTNYVYVRDGKEPELYTDFRALALEKSGSKFPYWETNWIRTVAMFIVVIFLLMAAVLAAFWPGDGKAFTAFMSAFTAALGYLAGKGVSAESDSTKNTK